MLFYCTCALFKPNTLLLYQEIFSTEHTKSFKDQVEFKEFKKNLTMIVALFE